MWTFAKMLLSEIAIVTEHLNPSRISVPFQPRIHMDACGLSAPNPFCFSVRGTIASNVINTEEWLIGQSAAYAFTAICLKRLASEFFSPSFTDSFSCFWVFPSPFRAVFFRVFNEASAVLQIIGAIIITVMLFAIARWNAACFPETGLRTILMRCPGYFVRILVGALSTLFTFDNHA